nr:hypothetical protein [Tanacetum cinerariifolium]
MLLFTDLNLATGPSTAANVSTISLSLDDINGNQMNDTCDLDKHLTVDSSIAVNVGIEAGKSNEIFWKMLRMWQILQKLKANAPNDVDYNV